MSASKVPLEDIKPAESPTSFVQDDGAREIERRIARKLDFKVVPILWLLFLVSFVDRSNIANAKIQGMPKDLHFKGNDYNIAVMLFTVAYIIFGPGATLIFKKTGTKSLSAMMGIWGILAMCEGFVQNAAQLKALRFLMGIFESGFVPGCAYVIGAYYTRDEYLKRYAFFFSASIIAGAFNGLLSTLLAMADGAHGIAGWRWIFIIDGIITVFFALLSVFIMVPLPEDNKNLTAEEKAVVLSWAEVGDPAGSPWWKNTLEACKDRKVWIAIIIYFGAEENASGNVAFQPTVLKGLGYTSTQAQIHSIPVYMVAWVIMLTTAFISVKCKMRFPFAVFGSVLSIIGFAMEIAQPSIGARYAGMFFITAGCYIVMPITVVWLAINMGQGYKRATALGMLTPFGNCGALVSSNVFISSESPKYHTGFSVGISMAVLALVGSIVFYLDLRWSNAKLDKEASTPTEVGETGESDKDKRSGFRYKL